MRRTQSFPCARQRTCVRISRTAERGVGDVAAVAQTERVSSRFRKTRIKIVADDRATPSYVEFLVINPHAITYAIQIFPPRSYIGIFSARFIPSAHPALSAEGALAALSAVPALAALPVTLTFHVP